MGIGSGKGAPAPADFSKAATPTQTNAFGATSQWNAGPDGRYTQSQSFGGPLGGAVQGLENQFAGANANPLDNGQQAREAATNAIYGQETSRLDPRFQQEQGQLSSQLAAQGLAPGSEAYNNQMDVFNRGKNDAYQQAQYGAIQGGGQEAQRQQQMDLISRGAPLAELSGLSSLTGQSQNTLLPATIAQYQAALQKYGIQQQSKNSQLGALTGAGGDLGAAAIKG
jgi:hypothetical protein